MEMRDGYIRVESHGQESLENSIRLFREIINKVIDWDCDRVLYVENYTNQIPMDEMLQMLEEIFRQVKENGIDGRIAIYDTNIDDHAVNLVSEMLAGAHGINARIFPSEEEAIDWLKAC